VSIAVDLYLRDLTLISCIRIFGANIPGKKRCLRFFFGGMQAYCEKLDECIEGGFAGFKPFGKNEATSPEGQLSTPTLKL